jgi:hypothetical protein
MCEAKRGAETVTIGMFVREERDTLCWLYECYRIS